MHDCLTRDIREPIEMPKLFPGSGNIVFLVPELNSVWGDINLRFIYIET